MSGADCFAVDESQTSSARWASWNSHSMNVEHTVAIKRHASFDGWRRVCSNPCLLQRDDVQTLIDDVSGGTTIDLLRNLHWLPIRPSRLRCCVIRYSVSDNRNTDPQHATSGVWRTSVLDQLTVLPSKTNTEERPCSSAVPRIWNSLSSYVSSAQSPNHRLF